MAPNPGRHSNHPVLKTSPAQDYVFITGSTMVNKTLPRLLQLSQDAHVILTGPSTPLSPVLYDYGVDGLSGMIITDPDGLKESLRGTGSRAPKHSGIMLDYAKHQPGN